MGTDVCIRALGEHPCGYKQCHGCTSRSSDSSRERLGPRVALKTPGGVIWAYWRGDPPSRGQFTDVELAVTRVLTWGEELEPISEASAGEPTLGVLDGRSKWWTRRAP